MAQQPRFTEKAAEALAESGALKEPEPEAQREKKEKAMEKEGKGEKAPEKKDYIWHLFP